MLRSAIVYGFDHTPGWEPGTVPYSEPDNHDCSAYVCAVLGLPRLNTATLVTDGYIYEVSANDLKPGDLIGLCGPGSEGPTGHIQFFAAWLNQDPNDNHYYCWEQCGPDGALGPQHNLTDWPLGVYKGYRYKGVEEDTRPFVDVVPWDDTNPWNSTLSGIASHEGVTVDELVAWNNITNADLVYPGQRVFVGP